MNPRFSYIRARRPVVGQLVRNTGFGSRISRVVAVEGDKVWLRGVYFTHKGTLRELTGTMVKHTWEYEPLEHLRRETPKDRKANQELWARWDAAKDPAPKTITTGQRYDRGGYWRTGWHRPCRRNY